MTLTSPVTPLAQAIAGLATQVVNLGLLFHWYAWTQDQIAGVNIVVGGVLAVVSLLRAQAQRAGKLAEVIPPAAGG